MARERKQIADAQVEAVDEIYKVARADADQEIAALKERQSLIAQCYKAIGQVQTSNMFAKFATVSSLVWLKQVKESKTYRDIPEVGTWEKFCDYVGMSRQKVDEDLLNLEAFGEEFLTTCQQLSVGYRDLRKLRKLTAEGTLLITDESIEIAGETIPLDPEHKEDLQAAIEKIIEEQARTKEDLDAQKKAFDRVQQDTRKSMTKLQKDLAKYEKEAEEKGLTPDEDACLQQIENLRISFDGYIQRLDPATILNDYDEVTPRMRAAAISAIHYMRMQILAAYDMAVNTHGDPAMNPELLEDFERWQKASGE